MDLYREELLEHYREPRHWGITAGGKVGREVNELCGDEVVIQVKMKGGVVQEMRFEGQGCAISTAAGSVVSELVEGKTGEEIKQLGLAQIEGKLGIRLPPRRIVCALLVLKAVQKVLS
jgi:nitrogen fixation NifU-like protein